MQGINYAFNLQGWMKSINPDVNVSTGYTLKPDGSTGSIVGKSAYNVMLNCYKGDYKAISGTASQDADAKLGSEYRPLYNGNISSMAVNIEALHNPLLYNYQYDQLNRLVAMDAWKMNSNDWSDISKLTTGDFQERVRYDANGNILTYSRNGNTAGGKQAAMDKLAYHYKPGTNQLDYVYDTVPAGNYDADIDAQTAGNYQYDSIGNLVKNVADSITSISWTVYGKISRIVKEDGTDILYTYGTDGNRISKTVIKPGSTDTARTWYVRDASGNVMSVYESGRPSLNDGHLTQSELHIYGSSRLGLLRRSVNMDTLYNAADTTMPLLGTGLNLNFNRGNKLFELSNHLGNVLVTLNDKKLGVSSNNTTVDYFNPQMVSAQDYYPFGMLQPGRSYNAGGYRYGFNGQEKDNETNAGGNLYTAQYWEYDARIGRRWNIDPARKDFESPYATFANNPIWLTDSDGRDTTLPAASDNKNITLPTGASFKTYQSGTNYTVQGTSIPINVQPGQLRSFTINNTNYSARWNSKDGSFIGYQDDNGNSVVQTNTIAINTGSFLLQSSLRYNSLVRLNSYIKPLAETKLLFENGLITANAASKVRLELTLSSRALLDPLGKVFSGGLKSDAMAVKMYERFIGNAAANASSIFKTNPWVTGSAKFFGKVPVLQIATETYSYYTIISQKKSIEQVAEDYDNWGNPIFKFYRNIIEKPLRKLGEK